MVNASALDPVIVPHYLNSFYGKVGKRKRSHNRKSVVYQDVHKNPLYTPSILTHFMLVLVSIHTRQGREHSRTKRRVETSPVRSTPTHTTENQSQYSVHDSLLQLLNFRNKLYHINFDCVSSAVFVSFLYVVMCPDTQTQTSTVESQTTVI